MYFSSLVKQELARVMPQNVSEQKGELLAFIKMKGLIDKSNESLSLILENPVMIKIVYFLFKKVFQYEVIIETTKKRNKKKFYQVKVSDSKKTRNILERFNLTTDSQGRLIEMMGQLEIIIYFLNIFLPGHFSVGLFWQEVLLMILKGCIIWKYPAITGMRLK